MPAEAGKFVKVVPVANLTVVPRTSRPPVRTVARDAFKYSKSSVLMFS